jgi:hypothetical protein
MLGAYLSFLMSSSACISPCQQDYFAYDRVSGSRLTARLLNRYSEPAIMVLRPAISLKIGAPMRCTTQEINNTLSHEQRKR